MKPTGHDDRPVSTMRRARTRTGWVAPLNAAVSADQCARPRFLHTTVPPRERLTDRESFQTRAIAFRLQVATCV
jgi:hypothetical protein